MVCRLDGRVKKNVEAFFSWLSKEAGMRIGFDNIWIMGDDVIIENNNHCI